MMPFFDKKSLPHDAFVVLLLRLLTMLVLFMLCRFIFYFLNNGYFPDVTFSKWLTFMRGGVRFDIVAVFYTNVLYLLLTIIPFRFKYHAIYQSINKYIFFITNGLALTLNCVDLIYYRFTLKRMTWSTFSEVSKVDNLPTLFAGFFQNYWFVFLIWILLLTLLVWSYGFFKTQESQLKTWRFYATHTALMLVSIALFIGGARGGDFRHSTRPITISNAGEYVEKPKEMFIVLNTPFCIYRTLSKTDYQRVNFYKDAEEMSKIYSPIHAADSTKQAFRPMNVVVIIVESLSKEAIGTYNKDLENGHYKGYTPFVDSLMKQSKIYWYSTANGSRSIEALPSVLTSIPSMQEAFVLSKYTDNKLSSLPNILREKGYETSFFHGAPNGSMGFQAFVNLAGVQHYYGKNEYNNDADFDGSWGIWDEEFLQFMAGKLNTMKQPFMSTVFTVSSHEPCKLPARYEGKFKEGPLKVAKMWSYTDMALRNFFEKAQTMPWYKNTLFVLTADHASTLAYFPQYKHSVGNFQIPIIFFQPNDSSLRGVDSSLVQQIDILPSVLGYLHYEKPYFSFGKNIFDKNRLDFAVNYDAGYQWFLGKHVLFFDGQKSLALYNFVDDKLLKNNELGKNLAIQTTMEKQVKAFIQQYNTAMLDDKMAAPKPPKVGIFTKNKD